MEKEVERQLQENENFAKEVRLHIRDNIDPYPQGFEIINAVFAGIKEAKSINETEQHIFELLRQRTLRLLNRHDAPTRDIID